VCTELCLCVGPSFACVHALYVERIQSDGQGGESCAFKNNRAVCDYTIVMAVISFVATLIIFSLRAYSAFNPAQSPDKRRASSRTMNAGVEHERASMAGAPVSTHNAASAIRVRRTLTIGPSRAHHDAHKREHHHLQSGNIDEEPEAPRKNEKIFNLSKTVEGFSCLFLSLWWFITAIVVSVFDRTSEPQTIDRAGAHTVVAFSWVLWIMFLVSACIAFLVKAYDDTFGGFLYDSGSRDDDGGGYSNLIPEMLSSELGALDPVDRSGTMHSREHSMDRALEQELNQREVSTISASREQGSPLARAEGALSPIRAAEEVRARRLSTARSTGSVRDQIAQLSGEGVRPYALHP